ncbi:MAG: hypothetical protein KF870_07275 [Leadbetterella sp.]|nr:hypothetical protein [Leadbetterella sp.]
MASARSPSKPEGKSNVPRTIDQFLQEKVAKPVKDKELPKGVVAIGDLIGDFFKQHNKKEL